MPVDRRIGPLTRIAIRELRDGEWHPYERTVQTIMPKVHPGKAARIAERARKSTKGATGTTAPKERVKNTDLDRIIRVGARALVKQTLRTSIFEIDMDANQIRIAPGKLKSAQRLLSELEMEGGDAAFTDEN
jgi:hypothetical protein